MWTTPFGSRDGATPSAALLDLVTHLVCVCAGWVEKHNDQECVVCPYHGWAFDSKGVCQHVPAAENMADRPKQSITEAYSVVEKVGT